MLASVLDAYVLTCNGLGRRCAYLRRFWMQMCIIVSVLHEDVHSCLGFRDYVDNCVEICMVVFPKLQHLARSAGRWPNARCGKCGVVYIKKIRE